MRIDVLAGDIRGAVEGDLPWVRNCAIARAIKRQCGTTRLVFVGDTFAYVGHQKFTLDAAGCAIAALPMESIGDVQPTTITLTPATIE